MSKDILAKAVKLEEGMDITFPLWKTSEILKFPKVIPKTYNIHNERITFVDETGSIFAIPAIKGFEQILLAEGFKRDEQMYVFFSSGEAYPTDHKEQWNELLKEMRV